MKQKKHLGQHWLIDEDSLQAMVDTAVVSSTDVILEVGPGPGALTKLLVNSAKHVTAVEFDAALAERLSSAVQAQNLSVTHQDILDFDFTTMPAGYKVVANIPYYLTSALLRKLLESTNKPYSITLLVQKEVAERIAAEPGSMSVLAVSAQMYAEVSLGPAVKAELFDPPPKVDSQIIHLQLRNEPLFDVDMKLFFRLVKAGYGEKRKKLINSLAGGLGLDKDLIRTAVLRAGLDENARAQELSLDNWHTLHQKLSQSMNL